MYRKYIYPVCILILFLSGCEEIMDIQYEGDSNKNLVIEGLITTDTTAHQVMLSWTGDFFKKLPEEMVSGAGLTITDGSSTFDLTEMGNQPGVYVTHPDVYGEVGKSYTLHISLPDGRAFSGTEELTSCGDIDSIAQSDNFDHGFFGFEYFGYDLLFYAQEP